MRELEGRDAFIAKKALIETRKDQYVIKQHCKPPVQSMHLVHSEHYIELPEEITIGEDGYPVPHGVSLLNPKICSTILCNYSKLRQNSWGNFFGET